MTDVPNKQSLQQSMRMQIQQQKAQAEQLQHPIKTEIQEPGKQQFGMQAGMLFSVYLIVAHSHGRYRRV